MKDIGYYWWKFIKELLEEEPIFFISATGRVFYKDVSLAIPGKAWEQKMPLTVNDLGYKGPTGKMNQLKRAYYNAEGILAAREKLVERLGKKREFTSVTFPTCGPSQKDSRSQGHCMLSVVATYIPQREKGLSPELYINISYRTTELTQKFGADLIFLHDIVIPALVPPELYPITEVRFSFANVFFSPIFMPILYNFISPEGFMEMLERQGDSIPSSTFKSCFRAIFLPFFQKNPEHYKYHIRKLMHILSLKHLEEGRISEEKVMKYLKDRPELYAHATERFIKDSKEREKEEE